MIKELIKTKISRLTQDFGLNLLASIITTGVSQIILYPFFARLMSEENYGSLLTLMGVANMIAVAVGGSLNNTRLLVQEDYDKGAKKGDFNIVLCCLTITTIICSFIVFITGYRLQIIMALLLVLFVTLCSLRSYLSVEYRIILNYKKILFSNICIAVGNLLGLAIFALFKQTELWPLPFLIGELFCTVYILTTTTIIKEPIHRTKLFNKVLGKESIILITTLSANFLTYLDRLILLPLLGGSAVSYYTVASFFGKSLGILMGPLAGVMLSYYAHKDFDMSRKLFWKINLFTVVVGVIFFIISIIFAPIFTRLLYPTLYNEAQEFLLIANFTAVINVIVSMIQPSVLKFSSTAWQLVIQFVYCTIYILTGFFFSNLWGLWGFSIAATLAVLIKLVMLFIIGDVSIGKNNAIFK